nr:ankyrin repeat-containing protein [Tanacetum cinerariifolium]
SGQHRTAVNERLDKFLAELGAVESKLSETMRMLSAIKLSYDQGSPKVGSLEEYTAVNKGEDPHGWIYKVERYFEVQDIQPRELFMAAVLCMKGQALSWFRWSEARSPFPSWEGLKRRMLERFQLSQKGTLYEQFLEITQEGSVREYVSLFETLAGQLAGLPEEVMDGTFIKGLRPELQSAV